MGGMESALKYYKKCEDHDRNKIFVLGHLSEIAFLLNNILMAFFTSVFLTVQMTGFNMGVTRVQNTAMALSMGKVATGRRYIKIQGTKNRITTVMWEPQVERAFFLPAEL